VWRPGWKRSARKKALAAIPEQEAGMRMPQVHEIGCHFCGGCQVRPKALDSKSGHEGVRGFEYHPVHLLSHSPS